MIKPANSCSTTFMFRVAICTVQIIESIIRDCTQFANLQVFITGGFY